VTDYSAWPYNCDKCAHHIRCNHHDKIYILEQIKDVLIDIQLLLEERLS
jgi:hypothetical protein